MSIGFKQPALIGISPSTKHLLTLDIDVILEFGFFSRAQRDEARDRAQSVGGSSHLVFLDLPFSELLKRINARNAKLPDNTFHVTEELLKLYQG
ncbi:MAG: hypothetical protein COC24_017395 [Alphaproteobacteria bacterium]|nr:hypothetical protein [Alphaproteobacteria bacterium]